MAPMYPSVRRPEPSSTNVLDVPAGRAALLLGELLGLGPALVVLGQIVGRDVVVRLGRVAQIRLLVGCRGAEGFVGVLVVCAAFIVHDVRSTRSRVKSA